MRRRERTSGPFAAIGAIHCSALLRFHHHHLLPITLSTTTSTADSPPPSPILFSETSQPSAPGLPPPPSEPAYPVAGMVTCDHSSAEGSGFSAVEDEFVRRFHSHEISDNQCSSSLVKHIKAPLYLVWSLVRRFDQPQKYKPFVSRCIANDELRIGSVREVNVKSGLPATTSTERLELLDDEEHILSTSIVGGDHRLKNYSSTTTLHPEVIDGRPGTLVIESFVVDVPNGNTKDETCYFVEALIKCNLKSLADVSERLAIQDRTDPIERI